MVIFHSYVKVYQRVIQKISCRWLRTAWNPGILEETVGICQHIPWPFAKQIKKIEERPLENTQSKLTIGMLWVCSPTWKNPDFLNKQVDV